jgi:hypothetical protein
MKTNGSRIGGRRAFTVAEEAAAEASLEAAARGGTATEKTPTLFSKANGGSCWVGRAWPRGNLNHSEE